MLSKAAGLVAAIAMIQLGIPAVPSAQATASPNTPKGSAYALIPAGSRVAAPDFTITDLNGEQSPSQI